MVRAGSPAASMMEVVIDAVLPAGTLDDGFIVGLKHFLPGHTDVGNQVPPVFYSLSLEFIHQLRVYRL